MPTSKQNVLDWQTNFYSHLLIPYSGVRGGNITKTWFEQQRHNIDDNFNERMMDVRQRAENIYKVFLLLINEKKEG